MGAEFLLPCSTSCCTNTVSLAINAALTHCIILTAIKICIFSNSRSALQLIEDIWPPKFSICIMKLMTCWKIWKWKICVSSWSSLLWDIRKWKGRWPSWSSKETKTCTIETDFSQWMLGNGKTKIRKIWFNEWRNGTVGYSLFNVQCTPTEMIYVSRTRTGHIVIQVYLNKYNLVDLLLVKDV